MDGEASQTVANRVSVPYLKMFIWLRWYKIIAGVFANDTKIGKVVNNKNKFLLYKGKNCTVKYFKFHKMNFNSVICKVISRISTVWKTVLESIVSENDWMSSQIRERSNLASHTKAIPRIFLPVLFFCALWMMWK